MSSRLAAWFPITLVATVAALTFWIDQKAQLANQAHEQTVRHDPDIIVDNFVTSRLAPDGNPHYTLTGRHMVHYADDDTNIVESPRLVYFSTSAPITASSLSAAVAGKGDDVYLYEDVILTRAAYADKSELVLHTAYLHVIPDAEIAQTDRPVTITDADTTVTGIGLEFDNKTSVLKLMQRVRGTYDKHR